VYLKLNVQRAFGQNLNMIKENPKNPIKPQNPFDDDDEDEVSNNKIPTQITIGDIGISSKMGVRGCKKALKSLLRDRIIKNYLQVYSVKKMIGSGASDLSYLG